MPRFSLFRAGEIVRSFVLDDDVIRIGRLPEVEITLDAATVSREHAVIRSRAGQWILEDSGSVNGVQIAGQRVQNHTLKLGDAIQVEDFTIMFEPPDNVFNSGLVDASPATLEEPRPNDPNMTFLNINRFIPK